MTTEGSVRSSKAGVRTQPSPPVLDTTRTPQRRPAAGFNGVKIFSATMFAQRDRLGETVSDWLAQHPEFEVAEMRVTQSSDASFHCVAITVFYWENR
jgi:hypothetical protein